MFIGCQQPCYGASRSDANVTLASEQEAPLGAYSSPAITDFYLHLI